MRKLKETVANQLNIVPVQDYRYWCGTYIYSSKTVKVGNYFFKYGSVEQFFPSNVVQWRSSAVAVI